MMILRWASHLSCLIAVLLLGCATAQPVRTVMVDPSSASECQRLDTHIACKPFPDFSEWSGEGEPRQWSLAELGLEPVTAGIEYSASRKTTVREPVTLPQALVGDWVIATPDQPQPFFVHSIPDRPHWFLVSDGETYVTTPVQGDHGEIWLAGLSRSASTLRFSRAPDVDGSTWRVLTEKHGWQALVPLRDPGQRALHAEKNGWRVASDHDPDEMWSVGIRDHLEKLHYIKDAAVRRQMLAQLEAKPELNNVEQFVLAFEQARVAIQDGQFAPARRKLKTAASAYKKVQRENKYWTDLEKYGSRLRDLQVELEERTQNWQAAIRLFEQRRDTLDPKEETNAYCAAADELTGRYIGRDQVKRAQRAYKAAPTCQDPTGALFLALAEDRLDRAKDLLAASGPSGQKASEILGYGSQDVFRRRHTVPIGLAAEFFRALGNVKQAQEAVIARFRMCESEIRCLFFLGVEYDVLHDLIDAVRGSPELGSIDISEAYATLRRGDAQAAVGLLAPFAEKSDRLGYSYHWFALAQAQRQIGQSMAAKRSFQRALTLSGWRRPLLERLWKAPPLDLRDQEAQIDAAILGHDAQMPGIRLVLALKHAKTQDDQAAVLAQFMNRSWFERPDKWAWAYADRLARQTESSASTAPTLMRYWHLRSLRGRDDDQRSTFQTLAQNQWIHLPEAQQQAWRWLDHARAGKPLELTAIRTAAQNGQPIVRQLAHWTLGIALKEQASALERLKAAITIGVDTPQNAERFERVLDIACDAVQRDPKLKPKFELLGKKADNVDSAKWILEGCRSKRAPPLPLKRWRVLLGRWTPVADASTAPKSISPAVAAKLAQIEMRISVDGQWSMQGMGRELRRSYAVVEASKGRFIIRLTQRDTEPTIAKVQVRDDRLTMTDLNDPKKALTFKRAVPAMPSP